MSVLGWIILGGIAMSAIALVGAVALAMPEERFTEVTLPLVAFAAGSLLGGAFFFMLPAAVAALGNRLAVYVWLVAGFAAFFVLEQFLHWHHCHRPVSRHRPLGYLILVADGLHNLLGGLAVGAAFIADVQVGLITWLAAAAHEVPQELGDFGILVRSGWSRSRALVFNVASASTFLVGGLIAYLLAGTVNVEFLVPFAAGNFLYIAAADLIPELTAPVTAREKRVATAAFGVGVGLLLLVAVLL